MLTAFLLAAAIAESPTTPPPFEADAKGTLGAQFFLPGGGAPTIGLSWFVADRVALRLELGVDAAFSSSTQTYTAALSMRFYAPRRGRVALFIQPAVGAGREINESTQPMTAAYLTGSLAAGVELFLLEQLSVGGTLGIGLKIGDLAGPVGTSPTTQLSTATSGLFASIYF